MSNTHFNIATASPKFMTSPNSMCFYFSEQQFGVLSFKEVGLDSCYFTLKLGEIHYYKITNLYSELSMQFGSNIGTLSLEFLMKNFLLTLEFDNNSVNLICCKVDVRPNFEITIKLDKMSIDKQIDMQLLSSVKIETCMLDLLELKKSFGNTEIMPQEPGAYCEIEDIKLTIQAQCKLIADLDLKLKSSTEFLEHKIEIAVETINLHMTLNCHFYKLNMMN